MSNIPQVTLDFFEGNEFAASTFLQKYALRDKDGNILESDPNQTIDRVMSVLANSMPTEYPTDEWLEKNNNGIKETWKEIFVKAVGKLDHVVPQGSILSAAGDINNPQSLSNCFVIDGPRDDMNDIFRCSLDEANLMRRRAGVGFSVSKLRPEGSEVKNAAKTSSGVVGWMNFFSDVCRNIGQSGRRGALLLSLDVKHPDADKFATSKLDLTKITGANISLQVSDEFMKCVEHDLEYEQKFPVDSNNPIITKKIKARELWDTICKSAHASADPGLLFWDTILRNLPAERYPETHKTTSVNPCGEQNLSNYDSCRLTSICLPSYVKNKFTEEAYFDFDTFTKHVRIGMRLLDGVVTEESKHIKQIIDKVRLDYDNENMDGDKDRFLKEIEMWETVLNVGLLGRRCGLGVHGVGDCFAQLCIRYDSQEALDMAHKIFSCFRDTGYDETVEMAKEYGPFPIFDWEKEKECEFIKRLPGYIKEKIQKYGRRNISVSTCAPTGTISILSQCSSGIEPTFRQMYVRRRKINPNDINSRIDFVDQSGDKWQNFPQFEKNVQRYLKLNNIHIPSTVKDDKDLQQYLPDYFITSDKIDWKKSIELQGVIQLYIDNSISKTTNVPSDTPVDTIKDIYMYAWKKGLKGITVYRDGCRSGVLITNESENNSTEKPKDIITRSEAPKRPNKLPCEVYVTKVKGIDYVVIVGLYKGLVYEIFCGEYNNQIPKKQFSGFIERKQEKKNETKYILHYINDIDYVQIDVNQYFNNDSYETATRLLSMSLRHGTPIEYVLEQLTKSGKNMFEFGPALSRILKKYVKLEDMKNVYKVCSHCQSSDIIIMMENGCFTIKCNSCHVVDSKCG